MLGRGRMKKLEIIITVCGILDQVTQLKLSRATIQRQVKQLIEMNLVVYKGSNKTGGYFAVK